MNEQAHECNRCGCPLSLADIPAMPFLPSDPPSEVAYYRGGREGVECPNCGAEYAYRLWAKWEPGGGA